MSLRPWKRAHITALLLVATALVTTTADVNSQAQPSFDVLRIEQDGVGLPYALWLSWSPAIVTTGDGGAWAFFSAHPLFTAEGEISEGAGSRGRLYASRFDVETAVWQPATAMPGGPVQFGPSAVAGTDGTVHVVYTDRSGEGQDSFGTLVYTRSDDNGAWSPPQPVAADPNAGHQLASSAVLDGKGQLHVVWQDQREVDPASRDAQPAHADIFSSSLNGDEWTPPVRVSALTVPEENASRPHIGIAGDRLVAVWSVYPGVTDEQLATATRIEWSSRALNDSAWSAPQTLVQMREGTEIGGRLLDIGSHPEGGAVFVYGVRENETNDLIVHRFDGQDWGDGVTLTEDTQSYYPQATVSSDGTAIIMYETASRGVEAIRAYVGTKTLAPDATEPSPEIDLTGGETGAQGRPVVTLDQAGQVWVLYLHQPPGFLEATEVRCLRGAIMPTAAS